MIDKKTLENYIKGQGFKNLNHYCYKHRINKRNLLNKAKKAKTVKEVFQSDLNLRELAEEHGLKYHTLYFRLNRLGWDLEKALQKPLNQRNFTVCSLAKKNGVNPSTAYGRIKRGWRLQKAVSYKQNEGHNNA